MKLLRYHPIGNLRLYGTILNRETAEYFKQCVSGKRQNASFSALYPCS
jgi:hypothetical protein